MAGKGKNTTDTPAGYNGGKGPGNALSLPIKNYPASTKMATEGKKTTIESPCEHKEGYHK